MGDAKKVYTQSDSTGGSTNLTPQRVLDLAQLGAVPHRGAESDVYDCLVVGGSRRAALQR